jgi:hypothetical protein
VSGLKHCLVHSRDRKYFILNSDEMAIRTTIRTDNLIIGGTSSYFKSEENEMNSLAHSLNIYMNGEAPFVFEAPYTIITTPASSMNIERVLRADKILDPGSNDTLWERKAVIMSKSWKLIAAQGFFNVAFFQISKMAKKRIPGQRSMRSAGKSQKAKVTSTKRFAPPPHTKGLSAQGRQDSGEIHTLLSCPATELSLQMAQFGGLCDGKNIWQ